MAGTKYRARYPNLAKSFCELLDSIISEELTGSKGYRLKCYLDPPSNGFVFLTIPPAKGEFCSSATLFWYALIRPNFLSPTVTTLYWADRSGCTPQAHIAGILLYHNVLRYHSSVSHCYYFSSFN